MAMAAWLARDIVSLLGDRDRLRAAAVVLGLFLLLVLVGLLLGLHLGLLGVAVQEAWEC